MTNLFGTRFPWVTARVAVRGVTPESDGNLGSDTETPPALTVPESGGAIECRLRYDGDFTYLFSASGPKRPLYFQLPDRTEAAEPATAFPWNGTQWRLHALLFDGTTLRERAAVHLFSDLQVPTPRVAHAEVILHIADQAPRRVGLYVLREAVDDVWVARQGLPAGALRLQSNGLNSWQYLGDEWTAYAPLFRVNRPPVAAEQQRIMAFAKLLGSGSADEFNTQISDYLDVDEFLRYVAAQAITANVTGFSTLGVNDIICLDMTTGRFTFVANELETALGSAGLAGTAEQLANLSVWQPYAGPCPLVDRLLEDPARRTLYQQILESALREGLAPERIAALDRDLSQASAAARQREAEAARERQRQAAAAGGPGFGPPPTGGPTMEIGTFLTQRRESILNQLAGATGYRPSPPNMGGFGQRQGAAAAISERQFRDSVQAPPDFQVTLFARSPEVNYPVAIAAEPSGVIYVGIDEQGSLGTTPGGGRVVRCVDEDGDGVMDRSTVFCRVDHVRGVAYRNGQVWVCHPPLLSVFRDTNGDGVADEQQVLVRGLTTEMVDTRGGDHTTNCVRIGIDGWLYIGAGDYGVPGAEGVDGSRVTLRGGGILRVRPDGTELELFASGLRNPFDIAIDPYLNLFTRDNTNDGGGWDTRISQLHESAEYGYPRLFANFSDEILPTLGTFGGGGGTGGLYVEDPTWPAAWNRALLTGDWGRSAVFHHPLKPAGPTFEIVQNDFITVPRATGMDIDASGNLYIASWWSGEASVYVGPHVGFVARVRPRDAAPLEVPNLSDSTGPELVQLLRVSPAVLRFHTQGEILHRGIEADMQTGLQQLATDGTASLASRVAALFTLKQGLGTDSHAFLLERLADEELREFAIRTLTDRRSQLSGMESATFVPYLHDPNPRVVVQAIIALGRLNDPLVVDALLPLIEAGVLASIDPGQPLSAAVIPHLAVQAAVRLGGTARCLAALEGPHWQAALRVMRYQYDSQVVQGLSQRLNAERDLERRNQILLTLIRLYQRETPYDGSWWGIRPDTTGPFYDPQVWAESETIERIIRQSLLTADAETQTRLLAELRRHQVPWSDLPDAPATDGPATDPIVVPLVDRNNPLQIGNLEYGAASQQTLTHLPNANPQVGAQLFQTRSCVACHTSAAGQQPVGPHLADIGKRYPSEELIESILKPSEKIAQGYETQMFLLADGQVVTGFVISETGRQIWVRDSQGLTYKLERSEIEERRRQPLSAMPVGLVDSLEPQELADLIAYLQSL